MLRWPERARAKLHAAAIPAENAASFDELGGFGAGFGETGEANDFDAIAGVGEGLVDFGLRMLGAEEGNREAIISHAAVARGGPQGRAERSAVVAGRGLHVDVVEDAGLQQAAVGGAVQRDAAGHRQLAQAGLAAEVPADVEHHLVEAFLQGSGNVAMIVGRVAVGRAMRDQMLFEIAASGAVGFAIDAVVVELKDRNLDRAVVVEDHGLLEEMAIARGIAVGREAHDLVFVGIEIEAEMQRDDRIQDADGILGADFGELLEIVVARVIDGGALALAHAVDDDDQAFVPARRCSRRWRRARCDDSPGARGRQESLAGAGRPAEEAFPSRTLPYIARRLWDRARKRRDMGE